MGLLDMFRKKEAEEEASAETAQQFALTVIGSRGRRIIDRRSGYILADTTVDDGGGGTRHLRIQLERKRGE